MEKRGTESGYFGTEENTTEPINALLYRQETKKAYYLAIVRYKDKELSLIHI